MDYQLSLNVQQEIVKQNEELKQIVAKQKKVIDAFKVLIANSSFNCLTEAFESL